MMAMRCSTASALRQQQPRSGTTLSTGRRLGRSAPRHVRHAEPEGGQQPEKSLEQLAQELLAQSPEASERLQRVGDAARRVAELQAEQAMLAQQMAEAAAQSEAEAREVERQQSAAVAEAELKAADLLLRAAQLEAEDAEAAKQQLAVTLAQDADRVESGKAAAVAGAAGTLASLPFVLSDAGTGLAGVLTLGGVAVSCLLFGVTYRYAVRQDLTNPHLKGGVVAAFGLVRGVVQATDALLAPGPGSGLAAVPQAALQMGESVLIFALASAAVEIAFRQGMVTPLGSSRGGGDVGSA